MNGKVLLATVAMLAAAAWLGNRIVGSADARASIAWAVKSWFAPPDSEADWEQQHD